MEWLLELFETPSMLQTVLFISLISAVGLMLGKIKILNVSLGITFVFFAGIIVGNFKMPMNLDMVSFAQNFGLILFIYTLGLQVGPGFFPSLKKGGLKLNMLSFAVVCLGLLTTLIFYFGTNTSISDMVGILSGSITNTPALGAAQEAYKQVKAADSTALSSMALACAITYPLGVVGVILVIAVMRKITPQSQLTDEKGLQKPDISEYTISNPAIVGRTIREVMKSSPKKFVFSRIWKDGKVIIPTSECVLQSGDHVLVVSSKLDINFVRTFLGSYESADWNKEDIDWNHVDNSNLVSRRIMVTRRKINGVKLGSLKLRNLYGINITRVNRAGMDLLASPELMLQIGDKLIVVGEKNSIENVAKILGDEVKTLRIPNLASVFLGIFLGLLLGAIPIPFPGLSVPIKLGIAGGPIIVGILMGAFGPRLHITTYTTQSANLMLRQLGLTIYLACLGLSAGGEFFDTVLHGNGLFWVLIGSCITIIPIVIVGFIAIKIMGLDYATTSGMLCGSMANPMALNYANSTTNGDEPVVSYATVYPVTMFIRIISAQLLIMLMV